MGQGGPVGTGTSSGAARARVELDVSSLRDASGEARRAGENVRRELSGISVDAARAQQAIQGLGSEVQRMQMTRTGAHGLQVIDMDALNQARAEVRGVATDVKAIAQESRSAGLSMQQIVGGLRMAAGVFGVSLGVAGVRQAASFALDIEEQAVAYARQQVAAENLAGSQARLNDLMESYHRITRGAASEAQAMTDVTRLMALGFADSKQDLEEFLRAMMGASAALGKSQDFIIQRLQLEMLNQTGKRLDELGLDMATVRQRADELRAANSGLTREMAYQQAVMDELLRRYGSLADSPLMEPTGAVRMATAWSNMSLAAGQLFGP